ncbi:DUF2909 domain-containing protein [Thalassospira xiamenensis]|nr:DUF2909 domain-containing protein [Thalassospira xiamenensis]
MLLAAKIILLLLLIFTLVNLFKALFVMLKNDPNKPPMSHYLGRRVGLSVIAIVIVLVLMATGVLHPNPRPY